MEITQKTIDDKTVWAADNTPAKPSEKEQEDEKAKKHLYTAIFREDRGWMYNEKHDWNETKEYIEAHNKQEAYEIALEIAEIYSQQFDTIVYKKDIKRIN